VHLNDSKNELNAHKDRHENIGYGKIGFKNLLDICYSPYTKNIPKILETPIIDSIIHTYKKEVEMIRNKKFID
jgi:deoxyribonuclease-4